jgi:hypothetical protein
MWIFIWAMRS